MVCLPNAFYKLADTRAGELVFSMHSEKMAATDGPGTHRTTAVRADTSQAMMHSAIHRYGASMQERTANGTMCGSSLQFASMHEHGQDASKEWAACCPDQVQ